MSTQIRRQEVAYGLFLAFFIVLVMPLQPALFGLHLSPIRVLLILAIIPAIISLISRGARPNAVDVLVVLFSIWSFLSLIVHHGMERFPYATIISLELLGGYILARASIFSQARYEGFLKAYFIILILILPFSMFEMLTGRMLLIDSFRAISDVVLRYPELRHGVYRAGASFPHPIHFGAFCATAFSCILFSFERISAKMLFACSIICLATITAMSSAPILSLGLQLGLIAWNRISKGRWNALIICTVCIYAFLELASNRGPIVLIIETLTLNPNTAWWRVYIWEYGVQNVIDNPLFGIGMNDWVRPHWLAPTVDNFWLLTGMRYGIPGAFFICAAFLIHIFFVARSKLGEVHLSRLKNGYVFSLVALIFVLITVHAWDALAVFVMFFLGAGSFFYSGRNGKADDDAPVEPASGSAPRQVGGSPRFTRFPAIAGNNIAEPDIQARTKLNSVLGGLGERRKSRR